MTDTTNPGRRGLRGTLRESVQRAWFRAWASTHVQSVRAQVRAQERNDMSDTTRNPVDPLREALDSAERDTRRHIARIIDLETALAATARPEGRTYAWRPDYGPDGMPETALPERVVVGANGAYWRDYGEHYSMCPVSEDNDPVEVRAVYVRAAAPPDEGVPDDSAPSPRER